MMHSLVGGEKKSPTFVLVHGGDRKLQNAKHWTPHFEWLAKKGVYTHAHATCTSIHTLAYTHMCTQIFSS